MARKKQVDINIQAPIGVQIAVLDSEARFKLLRFGRRVGKTVVEFIAAAIGHKSKPHGKGFLDGGEILWVARDYPNSDTIWRKQILRRFANKAGFTINKQDRRVTGPNGGSITICSADNIDSVRGGNWDGVVIDEAAHMDLHNVWLDVIRPGLADTKGWAIIASTTKAGSYFNDLCEKHTDGHSDSWEHFYATAYDNPKIDDAEINDMIEDYDDEVKLKQEVFAELVVPGGLAFGEWNTAVHTFKYEIPEGWAWVGCMDWGYQNPGWFGLAACGPDGETYFRWELKFQKTEPFDVGYQIGTAISNRFPRPTFIVCDAQMDARTQSDITVGDHVRAGLRKACGDFAPPVIPGPKGKQENSVALMHNALSWTPDPEKPNKPKAAWLAPRLRFHTDCVYATSTIPKLRRDEKNSDRVDSRTDDHAFDAVRYLLMTHRPAGTSIRKEDPDIHHGFDPDARKRPWMAALEPQEVPTTRYWRGSA